MLRKLAHKMQMVSEEGLWALQNTYLSPLLSLEGDKNPPKHRRSPVCLLLIRKIRKEPAQYTYIVMSGYLN
jgi:hypothetical protein